MSGIIGYINYLRILNYDEFLEGIGLTGENGWSPEIVLFSSIFHWIFGFFIPRD